MEYGFPTPPIISYTPYYFLHPLLFLNVFLLLYISFLLVQFLFGQVISILVIHMASLEYAAQVWNLHTTKKYIIAIESVQWKAACWAAGSQ